MENNPDYLRTPETVCNPDIRSPTTAFLTGKPLMVAYQYDRVSNINLHKRVPEDIRIQFETAKNLYLYAWFVYRFYPVADHHAYTCLELALRERFEPELVAKEKKREFGPGLKQLLEYAAKNGYLKNENFEVWRRHAEQRAKRRTEEEIWEEATRRGLNEITFHETPPFEIKDEDRDHKYIEPLIEGIPSARNHYAHGSTSLHDHALGTIRLVAEIINQIF